MDLGLSFRPPPTEGRVKCGSLGRWGVILSIREANKLSLSLLLCLELLNKFVVGGGWWVYQNKHSKKFWVQKYLREISGKKRLGPNKFLV